MILYFSFCSSGLDHKQEKRKVILFSKNSGLDMCVQFWIWVYMYPVDNTKVNAPIFYIKLLSIILTVLSSLQDQNNIYNMHLVSN